MGEYADDIIYGSWGDLDWEEFECDDNELCACSPIPRTCRFCGKRNLWWGNFDGQWRLTEDGKIHNCRKFPKPLFGGKRIL